MKKFQFDNGDVMPALGLGTWKSESGEVYDAIRKAIEIGYRHFDCAFIYQNEKEIGQALSDAVKAGDVKRKELWITSKLWNNAHLAKDVRPALLNTLQDLKLDYLDLYLIHWPVALKPRVIMPSTGSDFLSPEEAPLSETWMAMEKCRKEGFTKHIGVSNFTIKKIEALKRETLIKPEVNQVEGHPLLQQNDLLNYCHDHDIMLTAYSPLGSPDRKPLFKGENEPSLLENPVIVNIAESHGYTPGQVLVAWAIQRGTSVIPKSVNPGRMRQNMEAASITLPESDMDKIAALDKHYRYVTGEFWAIPGSPYSVEWLWDE